MLLTVKHKHHMTQHCMTLKQSCLSLCKMTMFNKGLLILLSMQYRYTFVDCVAHDVTIGNRNTERSSPVRVGETPQLKTLL